MKLNRCLSWTNQTGTSDKFKHFPNDWSTESSFSLKTCKGQKKLEMSVESLFHGLYIDGRCVFKNNSHKLSVQVCLLYAPLFVPTCDWKAPLDSWSL